IVLFIGERITQHTYQQCSDAAPKSERNRIPYEWMQLPERGKSRLAIVFAQCLPIEKPEPVSQPSDRHVREIKHGTQRPTTDKREASQSDHPRYMGAPDPCESS